MNKTENARHSEAHCMQLDEQWDMGRLIDLGGDLYNGMWRLPDPMPPFALKEVDLKEYCRQRKRVYQSHTQQVQMCVQASTYVETGAHVHPEMEKIDQVGLDRSFLSAVVLKIPRHGGQKVTAADLDEATSAADQVIHSGEALLIATGHNGFDPKQSSDSPHFSYDAIEWVVEHKPAILGSDMSAWQDPADDPPFFPMFLASGVLLLAPLVNLSQISTPRIKLIVLALKIRNACAAPSRVIAVLPSGIEELTT